MDAPSAPPPRRRPSLVRLQLTAVGLSVALALGLTMAHTLDAVSQQLLEAEEQRAQDLARLASSLLDGPAHASLMRVSAGKDAFFSWRTAPAGVRSEHRALTDFSATAGLRTPVRVLRISPTRHREVLAAPHLLREDGVERTFTSAGTPAWRHTELYRPAMAAALLDGQSGVSAPLERGERTVIEGYAPIFDEDDGVAGMVTVTLAAPPRGMALLMARPELLLSTLIALAGVLLTLLLTLLSARPGLRRLEDAAASIWEGRSPSSQPIEPITELERVATDIRRLALARPRLGVQSLPPADVTTTNGDATLGHAIQQQHHAARERPAPPAPAAPEPLAVPTPRREQAPPRPVSDPVAVPLSVPATAAVAAPKQPTAAPAPAPLPVAARTEQAPPAPRHPSRPAMAPTAHRSRATPRQVRIAALESRLRVGLGLGDWRRPARLIDITSSTLALAVLPERDPQLAPGMVAGIAIGTPTGPPYVVLRGHHQHTLQTRAPQTDRPEHHLFFELASPLPRHRLPTHLQVAIDARREARLRPPQDQAPRVALRPDKGSRSVPARVVDISASGIQITIPRSLQETSRWGRELELAVQLFPGRPVHRRRVTVQRCMASTGLRGHTALGLRFAPVAPQASAAFLCDLARIAALADTAPTHGAAR